MSNTLVGYRCAYCGTWLSGTDPHWCEKMHPNWTPEWNRQNVQPPLDNPALQRIALALERIADALEGGDE